VPAGRRAGGPDPTTDAGADRSPRCHHLDPRVRQNHALMTVRRLVLAALAATTAVAVLATGCTEDPEPSIANFCSQVETLRTFDEDLASGDPVRIQARADDLRLLQQVAPAEIEPSVALLLGVTNDFVRTAGTATDRDAVADQVFRSRSGDIAAIEAAGTAVSDYARENCALDLTGGSSPTTGAAPGTGGPDPGPDPGTPSTTTTSTPSLLVP